MIDVIGKSLKGYLNGGFPQYIIRGKDGNFEAIDIATFFSNYSDWTDYEKILIANHAKGRILDIGAGAGRHSLFLQRIGYEVHAIDNSPQAVTLMKIRGVKNVHLMDLRDIDFPAKYFDSALIMYNDLGLAGSIENTLKLFKRLFKITKPRGKVIVTLRNPLFYDDSAELEAKQKNPGIIEKMKIRMEYADIIGKWFDSMMVSPLELKNLIKDTGWFVDNIVEGEDDFYGAVLKKNPHPIKIKVT